MQSKKKKRYLLWESSVLNKEIILNKLIKQSDKVTYNLITQDKYRMNKTPNGPILVSRTGDVGWTKR